MKQIALPRMSIGALKSQALLEKKRVLAIFEGSTDRDILKLQLDGSCGLVDCYAVDDIEIEIEEIFRSYGANKARVISIVSHPDLKDVAGYNLLGLIDRDLDGVIRPRIDQNGIIYSKYTCLSSRIYSKSRVNAVFEVSFAKGISDDFFFEIEMFARRWFVLYALKERLRAGKSLPSISKSIRKLKDGGFDWNDYLKKVKSALGISSSVERISSFLDANSLKSDCRFSLNYHAVTEFIHAFGVKEGVLKSGVSKEEVYRHFRAHLVHFAYDNEFNEIKGRALAIQ